MVNKDADAGSVETDHPKDTALFEVSDGHLLWRGGGERLIVEPWGADSIRVRAVMMGEIRETGYALLPPEETPSARVTVDGDTARLQNGRLTVVLTATSKHEDADGHPIDRCELSFLDSRGVPLLTEAPVGGSLKLKARDFRGLPGSLFKLAASFVSDPDERIVGLGSYQQDRIDLKGSTLELAHRNTQASVPFMVSSSGYGFFWHNPATGQVTLGRNRTVWEADCTGQLDYWVTAGDTPAEIVANYARATGHVPMMPEWGMGLWQSKMRTRSQDDVLTIAREYHRRGLPLDVIVADFFHWPHMGDYRFEEEFWPDPAAMVAELRSLGIELMVSVWPLVAFTSENYPTLNRRGLLVRAERGPQAQQSFVEPASYLDMTNPETRAWLWQTVRRNYADYGIRVFWLDEAEPEFASYDFDLYRGHLGPFTQVGNLYPQLYSRGFFEGQHGQAQGGEKAPEVMNLVRAAWAGSQRYGALVWTGDVHTTWADLRTQIVVGIHLGMAGIPWFTTDIGGFHDGDIRDPAFRELLVRWFEWAVWCPVLRMHGDRHPFIDVYAADGSPRLRTGSPNEIWSYGDEVYQILQEQVWLREALRPYLRQTMAEAHQTGAPPLRGLFFEFPDDPRCWDIPDEHLLGRDYLIAPILTSDTTSRTVYLPAGARWTELATGIVSQGGQEVEAMAKLGNIPVFARDDAPLPQARPRQ